MAEMQMLASGTVASVMQQLAGTMLVLSVSGAALLTLVWATASLLKKA